VWRSIASDVDNIATVLRVSGLLPRRSTSQPLLDDAKRQLEDEADYLKEAILPAPLQRSARRRRSLRAAGAVPELTRRNVLAMSYVAGGPIEAIARRRRRSAIA
jgi:predicted unusual protein kinase regulating ubiquinone biosynthesis (AarF/ABC1/UbiB family)